MGDWWKCVVLGVAFVLASWAWLLALYVLMP